MSADRGAHLRETQDPGKTLGGAGVLDSEVESSRGFQEVPASGDPKRGTRHDGVLELIAVLCRSLDAEGIRYCHWKSNEAIGRSATGENDLDLLVTKQVTAQGRAIEGRQQPVAGHLSPPDPGTAPTVLGPRRRDAEQLPPAAIAHLGGVFGRASDVR